MADADTPEESNESLDISSKETSDSDETVSDSKGEFDYTQPGGNYIT